MNRNANASVLNAAAGERGTHAAPEQATSTKRAVSKKDAPSGEKAARKGRGTSVAKTTVAATVSTPTSRKGHKKGAKPAVKASPKKVMGTAAAVPREFSKKAIVLDLLRRKEGATMADIAKATGWQNHSIRGFISGTVGKKLGLRVESSKNDAGERSYRTA